MIAHKTKATGAVANGYTLNLNASPTMPHLRLVGNVISVLACWLAVSLWVLCLLCVAYHDKHFLPMS